VIGSALSEKLWQRTGDLAVAPGGDARASMDGDGTAPLNTTTSRNADVARGTAKCYTGIGRLSGFRTVVATEFDFGRACEPQQFILLEESDR
jgi:hypothetical protein